MLGRHLCVIVLNDVEQFHEGPLDRPFDKPLELAWVMRQFSLSMDKFDLVENKAKILPMYRTLANLASLSQKEANAFMSIFARKIKTDGFGSIADRIANAHNIGPNDELFADSLIMIGEELPESRLLGILGMEAIENLRAANDLDALNGANKQIVKVVVTRHRGMQN